MSENIPNPKMDGSPLIDAVPQTGKCPFKCRACYFNLGFYRETPFVPTAEEAEGKIVRVCSGNDANNDREQVIEKTRHLPEKYYGTSRPLFDFPGPVDFTCNPDELDAPCLAPHVPGMRLMSVRFRYAPWNEHHLAEAIRWYCSVGGTPLLITPMRYYDANDIPDYYKSLYTHRHHLVNSYYMLDEVALRRRWWGNRLVFVCAGLCRDCQLCVHFYHQAKAWLAEA